MVLHIAVGVAQISFNNFDIADVSLHPTVPFAMSYCAILALSEATEKNTSSVIIG